VETTITFMTYVMLRFETFVARVGNLVCSLNDVMP